MIAPSALDLLAEVRRVGGCLTPNPDGTLGVDLPPAESPRLVPFLRKRKYDLLMLLAKPEGPCLAGHTSAYWQDNAGLWHCMTCEPNPAWQYLRGVTLEVLGNRAISLQPPTDDLGRPGYWAKTPDGQTVELVLYEACGAEVLVRTVAGERLAWFPPEQLCWEIDWA